jgi:hypothetical protein
MWEREWSTMIHLVAELLHAAWSSLVSASAADMLQAAAHGLEVSMGMSSTPRSFGFQVAMWGLFAIVGWAIGMYVCSL